MKAILHISVLEHLSKWLNTREAATDLMNYIRKNPCKVIELDFLEVEFMSRSFADQLHKERTQLQNELNIAIEIVNANEEIINILRAVSNTQNKLQREFVEIPVFKLSNPSSLFDYLLSI